MISVEKNKPTHSAMMRKENDFIAIIETWCRSQEDFVLLSLFKVTEGFTQQRKHGGQK